MTDEAAISAAISRMPTYGLKRFLTLLEAGMTQQEAWDAVIREAAVELERRDREEASS